MLCKWPTYEWGTLGVKRCQYYLTNWAGKRKADNVFRDNQNHVVFRPYGNKIQNISSCRITASSLGPANYCENTAEIEQELIIQGVKFRNLTMYFLWVTAVMKIGARTVQQERENCKANLAPHNTRKPAGNGKRRRKTCDFQIRGNELVVVKRRA